MDAPIRQAPVSLTEGSITPEQALAAWSPEKPERDVLNGVAGTCEDIAETLGHVRAALDAHALSVELRMRGRL